MNSISVITSRGQITLPARLRKLLDLSTGEQVVLSYANNSLTLKPLKLSPNIMSLYGSVSNPLNSLSPDEAIIATKKVRAAKTVQQDYE